MSTKTKLKVISRVCQWLFLRGHIHTLLYYGQFQEFLPDLTFRGYHQYLNGPTVPRLPIHHLHKFLEAECHLLIFVPETPKQQFCCSLAPSHKWKLCGTGPQRNISVWALTSDCRPPPRVHNGSKSNTGICNRPTFMARLGHQHKYLRHRQLWHYHRQH